VLAGLGIALAALAVACGPASPGEPPAVADGGPVQPLARRQAADQAAQAAALQQAQEAAATAVAAREAADAAAQAQARAAAVDLLGQATSLRQAGQLRAAVDLARQALARWPDYDDAKRFLSEVEPLAAQATAQARPSPRAPAAPGKPSAPAPGPLPLPAPVPGDEAVLARALGVLAGADNPSLKEVAATIGQHQVRVGFGPLPPGALGLWQPEQNTITVAEQYRTASAEGLAGVLVHEATHAYDHFRGRDAGTTADCYDLEGRAFANQAKLWEALFGRGGKPGATDPLEKQMNTIELVVNEKPLSFAVELLALYKGECAG
jgi:hypothetical protein